MAKYFEQNYLSSLLQPIQPNSGLHHEGISQEEQVGRIYQSRTSSLERQASRSRLVGRFIWVQPPERGGGEEVSDWLQIVNEWPIL